MMPANESPPVFETRARGKLLLTGEYFVLDGARALALPVRFGQSLRVETGRAPGRLNWTSKNHDDTVWFQGEFGLPGLEPLSNTDAVTAGILARILQACQAQNPLFLAENQEIKVLTQADFPREWGLGTSSTLVAAVAQWADVNPYPVLFDTLGGSGYDIACAYAEGPLLYRLDGQTPVVQAVDFYPSFSGQLYFIHLGKKQDSREGIRRYRERAKNDTALRDEIGRLTERFIAAAGPGELEAVIREHETLISRALDLPRAKDLYFSDFWGEIKSLGAWGGDFVLATSSRPEGETRAYFAEKGFETFLTWRDMTG